MWQYPSACRAEQAEALRAVANTLYQMGAGAVAKGVLPARQERWRKRQDAVAAVSPKKARAARVRGVPGEARLRARPVQAGKWRAAKAHAVAVASLIP